MAIERARAENRPKPWGVADLRPWIQARQDDGAAIGEVWFERSSAGVAPAPSLLLKLLFTSQPLSIQVHPDDAQAQSMGQPCGKTEAWYVLSAQPDARIALGLKRRLARQELHGAVDDGSIADLVRWQPVSAGDAILVPAGTIHAIGAGLVIAEIQQRSDATFRMFDFGRKRELHVESAIAAANAGPADPSAAPSRLTEARTVLVSGTRFVLERLDLAPQATRCLKADGETWLLVLGGSARAGSLDVTRGDAVFAERDRVDIQVGSAGLTALVAYPGADPVADLLGDLDAPVSGVGSRQEVSHVFALREPQVLPPERAVEARP